MKTIDTRGHLCPVPLIMTKRAIKSAADGEQFLVLSDNDTARCNLLTFLEEMGYKTACREQDGEFHISFSKSGEPIEVAAECRPTIKTGGYIVVLKGETMGHGSDELGAVLMRACINSLGELDNLPKAVIMYNAGVLLSLKGKDTATSLEKLFQSGVQIIVCGACVDFYDIKAELSPCVIIGNMLKINTMLSQASSVVYP